MIKVILEHKKPDEIMQIVRELRSQGLRQSMDFDFSYHRTEYAPDGWECIKPEHTVFTFYTDKHATFFSLKYS